MVANEKIREGSDSSTACGRFFLLSAAAPPEPAPVRSPLPIRVILFDDPHDLVVLHIADDNHRAIFRAVKPVEEFQTVFVLVRHIFNVGEEPHGRVFIRVRCEGGVLEFFEHRLKRDGIILIILAENRPRLRLESLFRIFEIHEPVAFNVRQGFEGIGACDNMVAGPVVGGESVGIGAEPLQDIVVFICRIFYRAAEHTMLEEMREARVAGLDLIARTGSHNGIIRDKPRAVEWNGQDR